MAEAGASLENIQRQLGHHSSALTRSVYLHVTEARRKADVEKLHTLMQSFL
jgi:integrase